MITNQISIPTVESIEGFDRIELFSVTTERIEFHVIGKSQVFGALAADFFVGHAPGAIIDGHKCTLFSCDVTRVVDSNFCIVACPNPVFSGEAVQDVKKKHVM